MSLWIVVNTRPGSEDPFYLEGERYSERLVLHLDWEQATRMSQAKAERLVNWLTITQGGDWYAEPVDIQR